MDVKTLCLGVLMLDEATGYEIKKQFEEGPFAHFHMAGFGSIYPALNTLLRDGLAECRELPQDRRPDKKVYRITEAGRKAFLQALRREPAPDSYRSDAVFVMFFGDLLERDEFARVFEDHLADYRRKVDRLEALDNGGVGPSRKFVRGLGLAIYRTVVDYMENNRAQLLKGQREGADEGVCRAAE